MGEKVKLSVRNEDGERPLANLVSAEEKKELGDAFVKDLALPFSEEEEIDRLYTSFPDADIVGKAARRTAIDKVTERIMAAEGAEEQDVLHAGEEVVDRHHLVLPGAKDLGAAARKADAGEKIETESVDPKEEQRKVKEFLAKCRKEKILGKNLLDDNGNWIYILREQPKDSQQIEIWVGDANTDTQPGQEKESLAVDIVSDLLKQYKLPVDVKKTAKPDAVKKKKAKKPKEDKQEATESVERQETKLGKIKISANHAKNMTLASFDVNAKMFKNREAADRQVQILSEPRRFALRAEKIYGYDSAQLSVEEEVEFEKYITELNKEIEKKRVAAIEKMERIMEKYFSIALVKGKKDEADEITASTYEGVVAGSNKPGKSQEEAPFIEAEIVEEKADESVANEKVKKEDGSGSEKKKEADFREKISEREIELIAKTAKKIKLDALEELEWGADWKYYDEDKKPSFIESETKKTISLLLERLEEKRGISLNATETTKAIEHIYQIV